MRTLKLVGIAALVLAIASPAWAVSISPGEKKGKFSDLGSFYEDADDDATYLDDPIGNSNGEFVSVSPGDELRNIFDITNISADTTGATPDWTSGMGEELTGIAFGLTPLQDVTIPSTIGPLTPPVEVNLGDLSGDGFDSGGLRVYFDPDDDFTNTGPDGWTSQTTYPTVTDGSLWLDMAFIPHPTAPAGTLLSETLNLQQMTGSGNAFLKVIGGSFGSKIIPGGMNSQYGAPLPSGERADVFIEFDVNADEGDAPPWGNTSEDPFRFEVIPEPLTMISVFGGIAGLGGYIRKRSRA